MKALIESIFGVYTPVYTDVLDETGAVIGQVVASGVAGVDWSYVLGVAIFAIVLWSTLRIIGGVIHG